MAAPINRTPHSRQSCDDSPRALQEVLGKVGNLETLLGDLCTRRFPSLEAQLACLRELLSGQRRDHYTVEQVAQLTGRSDYTVRRWITQRKLKATRLAEGGPRGRLLIPRAELERLVAAGKGGEIPDTAIG